jgi:hypothetical protein
MGGQRDDVQPLRARRVVAPGLPGGENVFPDAEPEREQREVVAAAPGPGQIETSDGRLRARCEIAVVVDLSGLRWHR